MPWVCVPIYPGRYTSRCPRIQPPPVSSPLALYRLWPIALLAGVLPLVATVVAFKLSLDLGLIPACNPFIDGCVSISRAARHELPNILFRALLLPAAVLQGMCWLLCPAWLHSIGGATDRLLRALPAVGVAAAAFLVLYGTFLGTEGEGYRWMRRYGVVFYFGLTCIGMLVVAGAMRRLVRLRPRERRITGAMLALCAALPLLGLVHALVPWVLPAPEVRNALENITEWWAGAIFTSFFFVLAWAWHVTDFRARFGGVGGG